jgi:hypothetical protein
MTEKRKIRLFTEPSIIKTYLSFNLKGLLLLGSQRQGNGRPPLELPAEDGGLHRPITPHERVEAAGVWERTIKKFKNLYLSI